MAQIQQEVRQYGDIPSRVVVLHGGPGGAGEVEPLARELGNRGHAVLEPFQTRQTVGGQVDELGSQIERFCTPPVTVIGWSWGAWLGCLFAAKYGMLVRTLILVGSGPFEARYSDAIKATKNIRLTNDQRVEMSKLRPKDGDPTEVARFIALSDLADTYARDTSHQPLVSFDRAIHAAVWPEADDMRKSGALLDAVSSIRCPVVALHGEYDPRPSEGVRVPLQTALPSADFVQLERCGHKPWQETFAKANFYRLLENAIA
ncbi:MAG: alpha/beta hydrolase [Paracoccaceae bacterium]